MFWEKNGKKRRRRDGRANVGVLVRMKNVCVHVYHDSSQKINPEKLKFKKENWKKPMNARVAERKSGNWLLNGQKNVK